jgi:catechol 2,3-dioxygenase-like lactoylglutathione lyase family enzyme
MVMKAAKSCVDVGMVVRDIAKSLAFYEGLLGLKKLGELPVPFGRMHRLAFGDSQVKLIDPKVVPPAAPTGLGKALGFRYLTFFVSNLDEVCAACHAAGAPVELPKLELLPGRFIAMVRDPDGNVVEFVQQD